MSDNGVTKDDTGDKTTLYDDLNATLIYLGVIAGKPSFQYINKRSGKFIVFSNDDEYIWLATTGKADKQEKFLDTMEAYLIG